MFTGIVERGTVKHVESGKQFRIGVDTGRLASRTKPGDSISINGACLTVERLEGSVAIFSVIQESVKRSSLGLLKAGDMVNVEASLTLSDLLSGHIVQGHVDGTGKVASVKPRGNSIVLEIACGQELTEGMIEKGSVALDGVSLTIAGVRPGMFSVHLIPATASGTTLGSKKQGDIVNVELDIIGKYVRKFVKA